MQDSLLIDKSDLHIELFDFFKTGTDTYNTMMRVWLNDLHGTDHEFVKWQNLTQTEQKLKLYLYCDGVYMEFNYI
jgi:hypothetical protein